MSNVPDEKNLSFPSGQTPPELPLAPVPVSSDPEGTEAVLPFLPTERSVALHVKLEVYNGPLDLLLDLIKKNEMDIYNIPIAEITRQYLQYLETLKSLDLEIAGEFIVMAATLINI